MFVATVIRWKLLRFALVLALLGGYVALPVMPALAAESTDVTVTATPYWVVGGIGNFTITYVSETQLDLDWTFENGAVNIMIRAKYGGYPDDIPDGDTTPSDGYLVYYGSDTSTSDMSMDFDLNPGPLYYKAWGQLESGVWFTDAVFDWRESAVMTFFAVIALAGILTFLARYTGQLLMRMASALVWLCLGLWLLLGTISASLALDDPWSQVLGFVFVVMTFVPLTWQMGTEVRTEAKGKTWTEWGKKPVDKAEPRSMQVRRARREKLRSVSRR